ECIMRAGHGFCCSALFVILLLARCSDDGLNYRKSCLTAWSTALSIKSIDNIANSRESLGFYIWSASTWSFGGLNIPATNNWCDFEINELLSPKYTNNWWDFNDNELLSSWHIWEDAIRHPDTCHLSYCDLVCVASSVCKIKRSKRPCSYYSNSSATFHCLLQGDLVFKLNPGPTDCDDTSNFHSHHSRSRHVPLSSQSRNPSNLITVNRLPFNKNSNALLSLCLLNSRSVRNKSAAIFDYICECKADLIAVTETWLNSHDDAVREELCPDGYKLLDHARTCRQ
ncbi:hypothetical protein ACROYT_G036483, partial [Oculina patagonica]